VSVNLAQRQSDIAYEQLKHIIVHVEMKPGALINEAALMKRLGVGRTPLREALQRLAQENLVEIIPRRGAFVAEVSVTDLAHVFEMRRALEGLAARLAAERATTDHVARLESFLAEAQAGMCSEDLHWNLETDRRFHDLVAEAAGNPYLQQTLDRLFNLAIRLMYLASRRMTLIQEELAHYRDIIEAIKNHDGDAANRAMCSHLWLTPFQAIGVEAAQDGFAAEPLAAVAEE